MSMNPSGFIKDLVLKWYDNVIPSDGLIDLLFLTPTCHQHLAGPVWRRLQRKNPAERLCRSFPRPCFSDLHARYLQENASIIGTDVRGLIDLIFFFGY